MKKIFRLAVSLAVAAVLLSACGGDTPNSGADMRARDEDSIDISSQESIPGQDDQSDGSAVSSAENEADKEDSADTGEDESPQDFAELPPIDIDEKEYRFTVGDVEYTFDLTLCDPESLSEFDALEEEEYRSDKVYAKKRAVTSAEDAVSYAMEIFAGYLIDPPDSQTDWLLLNVMRDEANDAWGLSFAPAPLCPSYDMRVTFYSDGEMISLRVYGE